MFHERNQTCQNTSVLVHEIDLNVKNLFYQKYNRHIIGYRFYRSTYMYIMYLFISENICFRATVWILIEMENMSDNNDGSIMLTVVVDF